MFDIRKITSGKFRGDVMYALKFLPDKSYLKLFYFFTTGEKLNLNNPKGFCEKLQWLKINDRHPEYKQLVDKIEVKKYIDRVLGEGHTFKLLGNWKRFEDVDFSQLPEKFVLKCNHDSGSTRIIEKSKLTEKHLKELKKFYNRCLSRDYYWAGREYMARGIDTYLIAEEFVEDKRKKGEAIYDYKFFCFNGEPRLVEIITDRRKDMRIDLFDMDFNHLDIIDDHPNSDKSIEKPEFFDDMKKIAAKLSEGIKHVRIDLYHVNDTIYFGEYTFYNGGGFRLLKPKEWEKRLGDWIDLEK